MTQTATRPFVPSDYQRAIMDRVADPQGGSIAVIAVAGSGKTKTAEICLPLIPERASVQMLAFNAIIAKELTSRIEKLREEARDPASPFFGRQFRNVSARTFHSLGGGAVAKKLGCSTRELNIRDDKCRKLFERDYGELDVAMYSEFVCKLVSLAKGEGIGAIVPDTQERWYELIRHHDLTLDSEEADEATAIDYAQDLLQASNKAAEKRDIDFDDMLYVPLLWRLRLWQNDFVFIDECQPAGTMITVPAGGNYPNIKTKEVLIESLREGDLVVSYSRSTGQHIKSGRRLASVRERRYDGAMYEVECSGRKTRYTSNHWCWASFWETVRDSYFLYLMQSGTRFRIGQCKGRWAPGSAVSRSGLGFRFSEENADHLWILGRYDSQDGAMIAETVASVTYGIPMTRFTPNRRFNGKYTDGVWTALPDNSDSADKCLRDHGRDVRYPLFSRWQQQERDLTRPILIRACNLMDGMLMLPFTGKRVVASDAVAIRVERQDFHGLVYSMEVDTDEMYVGDGITTHNCQDTNPVRRAVAKLALRPNGRIIALGDPRQCIYSFTGASVDAIDIVKREHRAVEMPLTVSYRCARSIVEKAREIVDYIEPADGAPEGKVETLPLNEALKVLDDHDAILCRKTSPLITLAFRLIAEGRGCVVLGRDIGQGLVSLIKRMKAGTVEVLDQKLQAFLDREQAKYTARGEDQKAEAVGDRVECIRAVIENLPEDDRSVLSLIRRIEVMFRDTNGVLTLSTIHKSKGREWERVAVLEPECMPSPWARSDWAYEAELNVMYVCYTRAMRHLIFLTK